MCNLRFSQWLVTFEPHAAACHSSATLDGEDLCISLDPSNGMVTVCVQLKNDWLVTPQAATTGRAVAMSALLLGGAVSTLPAQEALRLSAAGQAMAEARKLQLSQEDFNVKLGPVALRFAGRMGIVATDNVKTENSSKAEADLSLRPQLNTFAAWRVTEKNTLSLGLGVGYTKYLKTTEYDSVFVSPDTDLSFDVFIGDFAINFHDRFDYRQDVSSDPTLSGTGSLNRFENTIGTEVIWDLNDAAVSLGYDHRDFIATQDEFKRLSHSAELLTSRLTFKPSTTLHTGLEVGAGMIDYREDRVQPLQDNRHIAVGPFLTMDLTEYSRLHLAGGYVYYDLDGTTNDVAQQFSTFYVDAYFQQRVGRRLVHTFSVTRTVQAGIASALIDVWRVQDSARWNLFLKTGLTTTLSYEHGEQTSTDREKLDRYGLGFTLTRTITDHLDVSLGYQFYLKQSDIKANEYTQNRLVLDLIYNF